MGINKVTEKEKPLSELKECLMDKLKIIKEDKEKYICLDTTNNGETWSIFLIKDIGQTPQFWDYNPAKHDMIGMKLSYTYNLEHIVSDLTTIITYATTNQKEVQWIIIPDRDKYKIFTNLE